MVKIVSHFNLSLLFLAFRVEDEALQQRLNDSGCGQTNAIYIFVDRRYHWGTHLSKVHDFKVE